MKTMFEGQVDSHKRINLLYDDVERHYHVIVNITGAMSKKFMCKACNKSCASVVTQICDQTFSDCIGMSPCAFSDILIPFVECKKYFGNHKQSTTNKISVC